MWPPDVESYYRSLAIRRGWSPETVASFWRAVEYYRELDESASARLYFAGVDDEGWKWFFEVVEHDDELIAVKQIETPPGERAHRYWWQHLDDDDGFLTDQPLGREEIAIGRFRAVTAEEFRIVWDEADERGKERRVL